VPCTYDGLSLNGSRCAGGRPVAHRPGAPCPDAPLNGGYLLDRLGGDFAILAINTGAPEGLEVDGIPVRTLHLASADDPTGTLAARYLGAASAAVYLVRPDQHVVREIHARLW
jgi:3-(3-hydroxy-phenyl)propionate hydroxylase